MNSNKILQELKFEFCKMLDRKLYSFDIKSPNDYVDVVFVTSVKTNKTITVYFDFFNKEISFWNDFDEKFAREFSNQGLTELFGILEREVMQSYYFNIMKDGQNIFTVPIKISEMSDDSILKGVEEFFQNKQEKFDLISVVDFLGSFNKEIIYDECLSDYIIIEQRSE